MREPLKAERATDTGSRAFFVSTHNVLTGESEGYYLFIMKDKRKEELQSRRQFFKKAAKSALPILGAIAIANMPMIAKAANHNDCNYGCSDGCTAACSRMCAGCQTSCHAANCYSTCHNSCQTTCKGTCYMSCSGSCDTSSR